MSHRTSLLNNEDPPVAQQETAQAAGTPSTLSSPTKQQPVQMPDPEAQNTTNTPASTSAIIAFLNSMNSHYATFSDTVTPHRFTQLCKDYNASKTDETQFYVAAYRLFYETKATHLIPRLRAFLPTTWREVDLEWLHEAIEGDSERQRAAARTAFGEIAATAESGISVPSSPSGSAVAKELDVEASATQPVKNKKRAPLNGFRATYDPAPDALETPLSPRSDSDESSTYESSPSSTPTVPRGHLKNNTTPLTKNFSQKKNAPSSIASSRTASHGHNTPTPTPSTPLPTTKVSKLPPASAIPHLGPVYTTTRAILARSHKPYVHALCGMTFGHPAEVHRHHIGQGGRPGCWEKAGKPTGNGGSWDSDESCKVKLADVQYVKVQEGWVVTSWGSAEKVLREDAGEELKGGMAKSGSVKAEEGKKKRKVGAKVQWALGVGTRAASEDEDESMSEDDEEIDEDTEPKAKRQKVSKSEGSEAIVSEEQAAAAARAVALGLRTRN